jgi:hypothetical protein
MRKQLCIAFFISLLLYSTVAVTMVTELVTANPYLYHELISPPNDVKLPIISVNNLKNNTAYASNKIFVSLNVSIPEPDHNYGLYIYKISYVRDWSDNIAALYQYPVGSGRWISDFSENTTLIDIPEGLHNVTFIVRTHGGYAEGLTAYSFGITSISSIYFSVDTVSPKVLILSEEHRIYETSDVQLHFTVNEPVTKISYNLDGLDNVTVAGNMTLTNLTYGEHNVTVFATDEAGNTGTSETVSFTIAEPPKPFPTTVVIAPIAAVSVICTGLLVYFKKRKH